MDDGKITIDSAIDTSGVAKGVKTIKDMFSSLINGIRGFGERLKDVGGSVRDALVPEIDASDINNNVSTLEIINREYEELLEIQKRYQDATRGQHVEDFDASEDLRTLEALNRQIGRLQAKIRVEIDEGSRNRMEAELEDLVYRARAAAQGVRGSSEMNAMVEQYDAASEKAEKVADRMNRVEKNGARAKKVFSAIGNSVKDVTAKMKVGLASVLKYAFGIRTLFALFNKMKAAAKTGFGALAAQFPEFNQSMSLLTNSLSRLKYSFAAAFAPLVTTVVPYIKILVDTLTGAVTKIGEFLAALTGQSTYYRAIETQEDYAKSLNATASAAENASGQLMGFDKLNVITTNSGSGASSAANGGLRYEEAAVSDEVKAFADKIRDVAKFFTPVIEAVKSLFITAKEEMGKFFETVWPIVKPIIESLAGLFTALVKHVEALIQALAPVAAKVIEVIAPIVQAVIDGITGILNRITESGVLQRLSDAIVTMLDNAKPLFDLFADILSVVFDIIGRIIVSATDLGNHILPIIGNILGFIGQVLGVVWSVLKPIIDAVVGVVEDILPSIGSLLDGIGRVIGFIFKLIEPIIAWVKTLVDRSMPAVRKGILAIGKVISGVIELLSWITGGFKGNVFDMLKRIGGGIANIALTIAETIMNGVKWITDGLVSLGIIKKENVQWVDEWTKGIQKAEDAVNEWAGATTDANEAIAGSAETSAKDVLDSWKTSFGEAGDFITENIGNFETEWDKTVNNVKTKTTNAFDESTNSMKKTALTTLSRLYSAGQLTGDAYDSYLKGLSSSNEETVRKTADTIFSLSQEVSAREREKDNEIRRMQDELYQHGVITWDEYRAYLARINTGEVQDKQNAISEIERLYAESAERMKESGKKAGSNYVRSFTDALGNLKSNAWTWGKDLCDSIARGMNENKAVVNSASIGVAKQIAQNLAYSEPEKGVLSRTHTWMPDMIKLLVSGINSNAYKVENAVASMAAQMKTELTSGYASLSNVPFTRPAMSTGTVLPYMTSAASTNGLNKATETPYVASPNVVRNTEELSLLRELIRVVKQKNLTLSPSASLGKVVNASQRLYQGVTG